MAGEDEAVSTTIGRSEVSPTRSFGGGLSDVIHPRKWDRRLRNELLKGAEVRLSDPVFGSHFGQKTLNDLL